METVPDALYMFALATLGLWKRYGWLMLICGIGVIALAIQIASDDGLIYGVPFIGVGLGMVFIGAFRSDKTGRE